MRLRSPVLTRRVEIEDSIVVVDEFHERFLYPNMIGTHCTFVDSYNALDLVQDLERARVVCVETRGERIGRLLDRFAAQPSGWVGELGFLVPRCEWGLLDGVIRHEGAEKWALRRLSVTSGHLLVAFVGAAESDPDAGFLLEAVELCLGGAPPAEAASEMVSSDVRGVLERYREMLAFAEDAHLVRVWGPSEPESSSEDAADGTLDKRLLETQKLLVETRTALDAVQRKYEALANSRLGALTLRHWERSRRSS